MLEISALSLLLSLSQTSKPHGFPLGNAFWVLLPVPLWPQRVPISILSSRSWLIHLFYIYCKLLPQHRPDHGNILPKAPWWVLVLYWLLFSRLHKLVVNIFCADFPLFIIHQAVQAVLDIPWTTFHQISVHTLLLLGCFYFLFQFIKS